MSQQPKPTQKTQMKRDLIQNVLAICKNSHYTVKIEGELAIFNSNMSQNQNTVSQNTKADLIKTAQTTLIVLLVGVAIFYILGHTQAITQLFKN